MAKYKVTVVDMDTGILHYEDEVSDLDMQTQAGTVIVRDAIGNILELERNGQFRTQIRVWKGFKSWEDYQPHTELVTP